MKVFARKIAGFVLLFVLGVASGIGADRLLKHRTEEGKPHDSAATAKAAPADEDEEPEPAAVVQTVAAVQGELPRTVEAFGSAAAPPTATVTESWPADIVVTQVLVQPGEVVTRDAPLAKVALTREAETQAAAARLAVETTTKALDLAHQRLDRGLATRTDVATAEAASDEAKQRLGRLQLVLPPQDGLLRAHSAGTIRAIKAQAGNTVTAGTPILEITSDAVVAQVGIDPADTEGVATGQSFSVQPIDDRAGEHWTGTLSLLAHTVNPTTHLVDATLTLAGESLPRPGTPLRAAASLPGKSGVIIPRAALVPDEAEMVVFVIRDGTAARTPVTIAQRRSEKVVLASGCSPGDKVVVSGQSQLTQGATVREIVAGPKPAQPDGGPGADH